MARTLPRLVMLFAVCMLLACQSKPSADVKKQPSAMVPDPAPANAAREPKKSFGAPLEDRPALSLASVLAKPESYRDQSITVEGQVRSACTRRGCWMEIATGSDPALPGCRVTFKDYGFFVPTDSAGARAKVQGTLGVNTLPPERVAHLESEGGRFPSKKADGSVDELRLVASGVELWR